MYLPPRSRRAVASVASLEARANQLLNVADWRTVRPYVRHHGGTYPPLRMAPLEYWAALEADVLAALADDSTARTVHLATVVIYSAAMEHAYRVFPRAADANADDAVLARLVTEGIYALRTARTRINALLLDHDALAKKRARLQRDVVNAFELDLRARLLDLERNDADLAAAVEEAAQRAGSALETAAITQYVATLVRGPGAAAPWTPSEADVALVVDKLARGLPVTAADIPGTDTLAPDAKQAIDDVLTVDPVARAAAYADMLDVLDA